MTHMTIDKQLNSVELIKLTEVFGSQNKVAKLLDVDRSRITRWSKGEGPDAMNAFKISGLIHLIRILNLEFNLDSIQKWFFGRNHHLNQQRPVELISQGKMDEVMHAALQDVAGSFA